MGGSKDKKEKSKGRRKDRKIKPESTNDTKRDGESRKDAEKKVKDPSTRPPPEPDRKDKKDTSSKPAEHHRHRRRRGDEAVSPDNVAMVMGTPNQGGQVTVMIQLDSVKQHTIKAYLTNMLDSTLESLLEIKRKKYTLLYIVSLLVSIVFLVHVGSLVAKFGIPPTSEASESISRFLFSLILTIILSPMAFYIINLKITNLGMGVIWMFLIVSQQYFVAITLSKAAVFLGTYNREEQKITEEQSAGFQFSDAFNDVIQYTYNYYDGLPQNVEVDEANEINLFNIIGTQMRCCDFEILRTFSHKNPQIPAKQYISFWNAIFRDRQQQYRPKYCCGGAKPCTTAKLLAQYVPTAAGELKNPCKREQVLDAIKQEAIWCLCYSIIMEAACVGMALVFLYYYSEIQGQDLANEQIPGDFEFLNLNRPHLVEQPLELSEKEKLRRQMKKKKLSKLRELMELEQKKQNQIRPDDQQQQQYDEYGQPYQAQQQNYSEEQYGGQVDQNRQQYDGQRDRNRQQYDGQRDKNRQQYDGQRDKNRQQYDGQRDRNRQQYDGQVDQNQQQYRQPYSQEQQQYPQQHQARDFPQQHYNFDQYHQ